MNVEPGFVGGKCRFCGDASPEFWADAAHTACTSTPCLSLHVQQYPPRRLRVVSQTLNARFGSNKIVPARERGREGLKC